MGAQTVGRRGKKKMLLPLMHSLSPSLPLSLTLSLTHSLTLSLLATETVLTKIVEEGGH